MLAHILPGFRDFRTPLITGYLWLVIAWIIFGQPIPSPDTDHGLVGLVNAASSYLSPAAYLAVLSFVAYVVGILLTVGLKRASTVVHRFGFSIQRVSHEKWSKRMYLAWHRDDPTYAESLDIPSGGTLLKLLEEAMRRLEKRHVSEQTLRSEYNLGEADHSDWDVLQAEYDYSNSQLDDHYRNKVLRFLRPRLLTEMVSEIPVLATKLQEKNAELFSSYDRERSEAEFRLSVAFPIALLSLQIWVLDFTDDRLLSSLAGLLGIFVALALLRKGWIKTLEASSVIVTALEIGTIQSQVIQVLDDLSGPSPGDPRLSSPTDI